MTLANCAQAKTAMTENLSIRIDAATKKRLDLLARKSNRSKSTPYIVPYRLRGERLELMAIFHGRQKWPEKS